MKLNSGVYDIFNTVSNIHYIGVSNNIQFRWGQHIRALNKGKHHNAKLQNDWFKYYRDAFKFYILEYIPPNLTLLQLNKLERKWINKFDAVYNTNIYNNKTEDINLHVVIQNKKTLKEWRKDKGFTQQELAHAAGIAYSTLLDAESFRRLPKIDTAEKIVKVLGIELGDVIWTKEKS